MRRMTGTWHSNSRRETCAMRSSVPIVGQWYRRGDGALLEIVAIDTDAGHIEVQYFDGSLDEFDVDDWQLQGLTVATAPEDWSGSVDMEPEDFDAESDNSNATAWPDALNFLDRSEAMGYSEWPTPGGERLY